MKKQSRLIKVDEMAEYLRENGVDGDLEELALNLVTQLEADVAELRRKSRNRQRVKDNDARKERRHASQVLTADQILSLPKWVRDELSSSIVIGKSGDVVQVPDGRKYHLKNSLNSLSGAEWTFFLSSVLNTRYPTSGPESFAHHIRRIHPSPKPPQLMRSIIEFFTKEGELVIDYFMGVGGTLLGASLAGRQAVGVELNEAFIQTYKEAAHALSLLEQETVHADSIKLLSDPSAIAQLTKERPIALVLVDPPYGDMMTRAKTGETLKRGRDASPTPFTELDNDLGNMPLSQFLSVFAESVANILPFVKPRGYVVVFMKDLQPTRESLNLLHADVAASLGSLPGLSYVGLKIWADQGVNLYPYGYPYAFVANQIHQYVLIFKKV